MYNYRLVTRDGIDVTGPNMIDLFRLKRPNEITTNNTTTSDWLPVTKPQFDFRKEINEEGEIVTSKKPTENKLATVANQQYEQATITHSPSKGEILGIIYRARNIQTLQRIINPYATHNSTTTDQLPNKSGRIIRNSKKTGSQSKSKIKKSI